MRVVVERRYSVSVAGVHTCVPACTPKGSRGFTEHSLSFILLVLGMSAIPILFGSLKFVRRVSNLK